MPDDFSNTARAGGALKGVAVAAATPVFLSVPAPPSVNAAYRNTARGRALTQKSVDWKGHAGWVLRQQRPRHVAGEVAVIVNVERGSASADIDNKVKLLLDLLVAHNVIEDDKRVAAVAAAWIPKHSAMAHLAILPAGQLDLLRFHPAASNGACSGWIIPAPFHEEEEAHDGL